MRVSAVETVRFRARYFCMMTDRSTRYDRSSSMPQGSGLSSLMSLMSISSRNGILAEVGEVCADSRSAAERAGLDMDTFIRGVEQGILMETPMRNWDRAVMTSCPAGCRDLPANYPDNGMFVLDAGCDLSNNRVYATYVVARGDAIGQIRVGSFAYRRTVDEFANDWGARYQDSALWRRLNNLRFEDTLFIKKMSEQEYQEFMAATRRWYRRRHRHRSNVRPRPRGPRRVVRILPPREIPNPHYPMTPRPELRVSAPLQSESESEPDEQ